MIVRESEFQRVQRQIDIGAVLVSPRRGIALHHLHRVLGELPRGIFQLPPVRVGDFGDNFASFFQRFEHDRNIEFALQRRFDANLDIVEVDEDRDLEVLVHVHLREMRNVMRSFL